jgi:hypothetical protein
MIITIELEFRKQTWVQIAGKNQCTYEETHQIQPGDEKRSQK